jgi:transposase
MKYFTGIDVSLRFVSICVVDEAGVVRYEKKVAAESRAHRGQPATLQR